MLNVVLNLDSVHPEMSFWKIEYAHCNKADTVFITIETVNCKALKVHLLE